MASTLSLLHLLLFALSLHSTATALQFSDDVYDFFQQDLSRSFSPAPRPLLPPLLSPSISPSPAAYATANRTSNETRDGPLASAFFTFGDSSVDCGTNSFLGTLARADRLPYGRDFDTHQPTGRFCNGRLAVDYLASQLGLPLVPSYLGHNRSIEDMIHGVNYASAASGIIFSSGSELGQHVALTQQIQQFMDTFQTFMVKFGQEAAVNLISSSVFYISSGTNDYIHYYFRNVSGVQSKYFPWSFNRFLVKNVKQEIKKLYDSNVRKVVVLGLAPMGCAPHYLWKYNSTNGECIQEINDMMTEFNYGMRYMVQELNTELHGASIIFCDVFAAGMELIKNPDCYDACCGVGKYKGWILCISPLMACHNASTHIWCDQFHPIDAVNEMLADNVQSSLACVLIAYWVCIVIPVAMAVVMSAIPFPWKPGVPPPKRPNLPSQKDQPPTKPDNLPFEKKKKFPSLVFPKSKKNPTPSKPKNPPPPTTGEEAPKNPPPPTTGEEAQRRPLWKRILKKMRRPFQ